MTNGDNRLENDAMSVRLLQHGEVRYSEGRPETDNIAVVVEMKMRGRAAWRKMKVETEGRREKAHEILGVESARKLAHRNTYVARIVM